MSKIAVLAVLKNEFFSHLDSLLKKSDAHYLYPIYSVLILKYLSACSLLGIFMASLRRGYPGGGKSL